MMLPCHDMLTPTSTEGSVDVGLALIVHGGAGRFVTARQEPAREGCRAAAAAGWEVLRRGGTALAAVEAAIIVLEDDPEFDAGRGSFLNAEGRVQMDAGVMDGMTLDVGSVACVERVRHPVVLAGAVLRSPHVLLVGPGAEEFAVESGIPLCDPAELVTPEETERWASGRGAVDDETGDAGGRGQHPDTVRDTEHGTVGAVAVDGAGRLAAATSTGGIAGKHPGRIGDTPLVGCGFYAEHPIGAVSSTGDGEAFIRMMLARRAAGYLEAGLTAQAAAEAAIRVLADRVGAQGGLIVLDAAGHFGCAWNTPEMACAHISEGMAAPYARCGDAADSEP